MDARKTGQALKQLRHLKIGITEKIVVGTQGKYLINNLLTAIDKALGYLESLDVPQRLAGAKQATVVEIRRAKAIISQEHLAQPFSPNGEESLTNGMIKEADAIRDALRQFDDKGLFWLKNPK